MADTILEYLKKALDSEIQATTLLQLPGDFYSKISVYSQKLRRSTGSSASEVANQLISRQARMIDSMARELLIVRANKAIQQRAFPRLLPEERYVWSAQQKFQRRFEIFIGAVSAGQPSFIEFAHRSEVERSISVRLTKHVDELVGPDLRYYGPFEAEDVVSLPAANADILIADGDAVEICTREGT
jgi:DNA replication initiation complex subunit (GINS family)